MFDRYAILLLGRTLKRRAPATLIPALPEEKKMRSIITIAMLLVTTSFAMGAESPLSSECMAPYVTATKATHWESTHEDFLEQGMDACETRQPWFSPEVKAAILHIGAGALGLVILLATVQTLLTTRSVREKEALSELEVTENDQNHDRRYKELQRESEELRNQNAKLTEELKSLAPQTWEEWQRHLAKAKEFYRALTKEMAEISAITDCRQRLVEYQPRDHS
ncbi:MAG: hypothetical protein KBD21_03610 [Candidatus Pacebacteria bacterium]|nr:hypothetical protein [Candidatus Paceibacterota bacterium]